MYLFAPLIVNNARTISGTTDVTADADEPMKNYDKWARGNRKRKRKRKPTDTSTWDEARPLRSEREISFDEGDGTGRGVLHGRDGNGSGGYGAEDLEGEMITDTVNIFLRDAAATKGIHCRLGMNGVRKNDERMPV